MGCACQLEGPRTGRLHHWSGADPFCRAARLRSALAGARPADRVGPAGPPGEGRDLAGAIISRPGLAVLPGSIISCK
jgi:hypothetical protein